MSTILTDDPANRQIRSHEDFFSRQNRPDHTSITDDTAFVNPPAQGDLLTWFFDTFVVQPSRGYALMNPPGHAHKYVRRTEIFTPDLLFGALNGQTRRVPIGGGG